MKVVGIVIFVALALFVCWFAIDTIRVVVKKIKAKKKAKEIKDNTTDVNNQ